MTVTVQSVIDRVQVTLQDTTGIRWPVVGELVLFVNDAQREIALLKPDASATTANVQLVTGTRQTIPAAGNRLLTLVRNMSDTSGGATGGRAIRLVSGEVLNAQTPDWHNASASSGTDAAHTTVVKHYVYDEQNPRVFYVYPGVAGNAYAEIVYSANPSTVAQNGNLDIPDIFANAVTDYVLYRAYLKDAEYAANQTRAATHYNLFVNSLTGKGQIDMVTSPNNDVRGITLKFEVFAKTQPLLLHTTPTHQSFRFRGGQSCNGPWGNARQLNQGMPAPWHSDNTQCARRAGRHRECGFKHRSRQLARKASGGKLYAPFKIERRRYTFEAGTSH